MNPPPPSPVRCILDTSILVCYIRANALGQWVENNYLLQSQPSAAIISAVTVGEIRSLATRNNWGENKKKRLKTLLNDVVVVPIDIELIYQAYESIDNYSLKNGRKMGKNDLWIAATAQAAGVLLLTTDTDFDHLYPTIIKRNYLDPDNPQNWKFVR